MAGGKKIKQACRSQLIPRAIIFLACALIGRVKVPVHAARYKTA